MKKYNTNIILHKEIKSDKIEQNPITVPNPFSDELGNLCKDCTQQDIFFQTTTTWNLTLENMPQLINMLKLFETFNQNISLLKLQSLLDTILRYSNFTPQNEKKLTEQEILKIINEYLKLIDISDDRTYQKITSMSILINGTIKEKIDNILPFLKLLEERYFTSNLTPELSEKMIKKSSRGIK